MALVETLIDTFDAAALDAAKWSTFVLGGAVGTIDQAGGKLRLTMTSNAVGNFLLVRSVASFEFTGSRAFARLSSALIVAGSGAGGEALFGVDDAEGDGVGWHQQSTGVIEPQWRLDGVSDTPGAVSYTPSTHAWLSVREEAGTVYWESAPSSASDPPLDEEWVVRYSKPVSELGSFNFAAVNVRFGLNYWSGPPAAPTGPVQFDCVNTQTRANVSHEASGALGGAGAALAGAAAIKRTHDATGALAASGAALAAAAWRGRVHYASGALVGGSAIIQSIGSTSDETRRVWFENQDMEGAWDDKPQTSDPWTAKPDAGGAWGS